MNNQKLHPLYERLSKIDADWVKGTQTIRIRLEDTEPYSQNAFNTIIIEYLEEIIDRILPIIIDIAHQKIDELPKPQDGEDGGGAKGGRVHL